MLINKIAIIEEKNKQPKYNNELFISNQQNNIQIIPDFLIEKKTNKLENGLIEINRDDNTEDNSYLLSDKKSIFPSKELFLIFSLLSSTLSCDFSLIGVLIPLGLIILFI